MKVNVRQRPRPKAKSSADHAIGCCCWDCMMWLEEWIREVAFARAMREVADTDQMIRTKQFPLSQQIEEVEREIGMRKQVYPRWVATGKMRRGESEYHLARMESVLKTLKWMQQNETTIKAAVKQPEQPASLHMHVKDEPAPPYPGTKPGGIAERASGQPYPAEGK